MIKYKHNQDKKTLIQVSGRATFGKKTMVRQLSGQVRSYTKQGHFKQKNIGHKI